ncbi:hypothetical protein F5Y00DRAFT_270987 [Daldinia vernicosa]|uniref:uncharacterized protein n=1 Tax=Daldinia vernicosa TaxID=114800 RepID=UPI0020076A7E|nr:uncharacterized protein F5Y00DRAFT_270987 [Daldinia vernicosa]KAI0847628.1 hypothetical protein F5Y00DRAFT_270987 [Daldinia vernicosa]
MESIFLKSINWGILVEKEIVVQTNHEVVEDLEAPHPPSIVSIIRSGFDLRGGTTTSEALQRPSSRPQGKMVSRPDVGEGENPEEGLADFFRSEPPPGNFMSIPDDVSVYSVHKKWDMFKVFGKRRKSRKRQPPLIRLPDTAISARTISGHRYIAISVPSGNSHSESIPTQQQSALRPIGAKFQQEIGSEHSPASNRNIHNIQVSRPVTGDRESQSSASLAPRSLRQPEAFTFLASPPRKASMLSTLPSHEEEPYSSKGKEPDRQDKSESNILSKSPISPSGASRTTPLAERESRPPIGSLEGRSEQQMKAPDLERLETGTVPRIVESPPQKQAIQESEQKQPEQTSDNSMTRGRPTKAEKSPGSPRILSTNLLSMPDLPVRTSSKRAVTTARAKLNGAEDAAIDRLEPISRAATGSNTGSGNETAAGNRASFAESLMTDSSPKVLKAETATAYHPIVVRTSSSRPEIHSPLNLNFPSPPTDKTNRSVQANLLSPPTTSEGTPSRKDRVRERKKRDMEKLKAKIYQPPASRLLQVESQAENAWPESPVLGRFNQDLGLPPSRPYITGKMSDISPIRPSIQLKSPYLSAETVAKKRRKRSISAPVLTSSSSPSSSPLEPLRAAPWEDSTSYYRRRERLAEHEEAAARRTRYAAHALAEQNETREWAMRQKLLRRYEKLKESRTKDMEKRLRRVERNGEILMQTLVSLMKTLDTLLQDRQVLQRSVSSAYPAASSVPQPQSQPHRSAEGRTQSLRSARSFDNSLPMLRSQPEQREIPFRRHRPRSLRLSGHGRQSGTTRCPQQSGGGQESSEADTRVRQSALEALQAQLQSQSRFPRSARAGGLSSYSSSISNTHSDETGSLEVMEPLMRELQEAAGYGVERRQGGEREEKEGGTSLSESEVFNLF